MSGMINIRCRNGRTLLARRGCDHVIMPDAVLGIAMVVRRGVLGVAMVVRRGVLGVAMVVRRAVLGVAMVVRRAVLAVHLASRLRMIMLVRSRCWFGEWIADVVWNRLARTVVSAIPHPAGQLS
jgi:hypothetical protein